MRLNSSIGALTGHKVAGRRSIVSPERLRTVEVPLGSTCLTPERWVDIERERKREREIEPSLAAAGS